MSERRRVGALAIVVAATMLAGCGSSGGSASDRGGSPAQRGGPLRIAIATPAENLDPHAYEGLWQVQDLVFEPLVRYGEDGRIEPALAESWEISKDGKTYTFHLRQGVEFSDGTPFDAKAVEWNFERWIRKEDWLGVSQWFRRMEVADARTFVLELERQYPPALQELSYVRPVRILSPSAVGSDGKYREPIGTGPWTIESSTRTETVMVPNPRHWGPRPAPERLELMVIPDAQSRLSALRAGDVDIIGGDFTAPMTPRDVLTLKGVPNVHVVTEPGTGTLVLGFNEDRPPMSDQAVREAVSLTIDRKAIAKALYLDQAQPAAGLFPPTVPYSGEAEEIRPPDVERAKALLDAAGWTQNGDIREKGGRRLSMVLVASEEALPGARSLSEVIQSQLGELGAEVKIELLDHASRHSEIPKRQYDLAFYLTLAAPYDPYSTLSDLFDSRKDSGVDGKIFTDPAFDAHIDAVFAAQSEDERRRSFDEAYGFLAERHAQLPLVHPPRIWAHGDRISDLKLAPTEYEFPVRGIGLQGVAGT